MNKILQLSAYILSSLVMVICLDSCISANSGKTFEVGRNAFVLNGKPFVVKAAEVHYPRIPEPYWEQRILSCKALGMNTIVCTYSGICTNRNPVNLILLGIKI